MNRDSRPLVSAVIPTRNRPQLVQRAVRSALQQKYPALEVIVVIDGPDAETQAALHALSDPRIRVLSLPACLGGAGARNQGVAAAQGEWIAFLDDDDEWVAEKLDMQMRVAQTSTHRYPIISSRILARTPQAEYLWPRRIPGPSESICEYLLARNSLFQGEGLIATPTILAPKSLLDRVPFRPIRKHQDWDWVLRVVQLEGVAIEFCGEVLSICYMDQPRPGISNTPDWKWSLEWAHQMRPYMTARAYAAFLLTVVAAQAATTVGFCEYLRILQKAFDLGSPRLLDVALFAGMRFVPRGLRHTLRSVLSR